MERILSNQAEFLDIFNWYKADIRLGVLDLTSDNYQSQEFTNWTDGLHKRYRIIRHKSERIKFRIWFECLEDLTFYLLTFDAIPRRINIDDAFYYCPYIPLTITGALMPIENNNEIE